MADRRTRIILRLVEAETRGEFAPDSEEQQLLDELRAAGEIPERVGGPLPPSPRESLGAGFHNLYSGIEQLRRSGPDLEAYTRETSENRRRFEEGQAAIPHAGNRFGSQALQLTGEFLAPAAVGGGLAGAGGRFIPHLMRGRLAPMATTRGGKLGLATGTGAAAGGSVFTEEDESRLANAALGAGMGAAGPAVVSAATRIPGISSLVDLTSRGARRAADKLANIHPNNPLARPAFTPGARKEFFDQNRNRVRRELRTAGVTVPNQDAVIDRTIQANLDRGNRIDPQQIAREVRLNRENITPTRALVTQEPADVDLEQDLMSWGQRSLADIAETNRDVMVRNVGGTIGDVSRPGIRREAGQAIGRIAQTADNRLGAATDKAFRDVRNMASYNGAINPRTQSRFGARVNLIFRDGEGILKKGPYYKRLDDVVNNPEGNTLTVREADKIWDLISERRGEANVSKKEGRLLGQLHDALRGAVAQENTPAARGLSQAWGVAAQREAHRNSTRAIKDVLSDNFEPDDFIEKHIIKARTDDVQALMNYADNPNLTDSERTAVNSALDRVRDAFRRHMRTKFISGTSEDLKVNSAALARFRDDFEPEKVEAIIPGLFRELDRLSGVDALRLGRSSVSVGSTPALGSVVEGIANIAQRYPGLGIPARAVQFGSRQGRSRIGQMFDAAAARRAANLLPEQTPRGLAGLAFGGTAGGLTAPEVIQALSPEDSLTSMLMMENPGEAP